MRKSVCACVAFVLRVQDRATKQGEESAALQTSPVMLFFFWGGGARVYGFQGQGGWRELLGRFKAGNGKLLDLEFLTDDKGGCVSSCPASLFSLNDVSPFSSLSPPFFLLFLAPCPPVCFVSRFAQRLPSNPSKHPPFFFLCFL